MTRVRETRKSAILQGCWPLVGQSYRSAPRPHMWARSIVAPETGFGSLSRGPGARSRWSRPWFEWRRPGAGGRGS